MSWYELLKSLHVLAIATWFGSGIALTVLGYRSLAAGAGPYGSFVVNAAWWASRAHPTAGVVALLTGFGMVADADYSMGDTWLWLGLLGLVVSMGIGGALIGRTADGIVKSVEGAGGALPEAQRPAVGRLLLYVRIELAIVALVVFDMVAKPGL
ncbi:MAG TPA: hypothetical protein VF549_13230 [Solirubrobacteraceae bacterium]|jgi:uncharacterized membrane protein